MKKHFFFIICLLLILGGLTIYTSDHFASYAHEDAYLDYAYELANEEFYLEYAYQLPHEEVYLEYAYQVAIEDRNRINPQSRIIAYNALHVIRYAKLEIVEITIANNAPPIIETPLLAGQIPLHRPVHIDPTRPMVALTFDDGPSKYTWMILDIFERYDAHATFFVVGRRLESHNFIAVRTVDLGHELVGHSWDHSNLTRLNADQIRHQILHTNAAVEAITGVETRIFRPPYGATNDRVANVSRELGFAMINWSIDPRDWQFQNPQLIYDHVMSRVENNAIILFHDVYETTVEAIEKLLPSLIEQGYQLVTVSELLSFSYDYLNAGRIYRHGRI